MLLIISPSESSMTKSWFRHDAVICHVFTMLQLCVRHDLVLFQTCLEHFSKRCRPSFKHMLVMCETYLDHVADSAHNKILLLHKGLPVHCNTTNAEPMRPASAKSETPLSTTLQEHGGGSCEALEYKNLLK